MRAGRRRPRTGAGDRHRPSHPPVVSRGVDVSGIDSSEAMVAKLRAKPGGERVADIMGDFGVCLISWIRLASRRKQRLL
jgi:hypothetical protein